MNPNISSSLSRRSADDILPVLEPAIIQRIRQALDRVGDFGDVRLVVVKGEIKYIQVMRSESISERPGA